MIKIDIFRCFYLLFLCTNLVFSISLKNKEYEKQLYKSIFKVNNGKLETIGNNKSIKIVTNINEKGTAINTQGLLLGFDLKNEIDENFDNSYTIQLKETAENKGESIIISLLDSNKKYEVNEDISKAGHLIQVGMKLKNKDDIKSFNINQILKQLIENQPNKKIKHINLVLEAASGKKMDLLVGENSGPFLVIKKRNNIIGFIRSKWLIIGIISIILVGITALLIIKKNKKQNEENEKLIPENNNV